MWTGGFVGSYSRTQATTATSSTEAEGYALSSGGADLTRSELSKMSNRQRGFHGDDFDVFAVTKAYMHSSESKQPVLALPQDRAARAVARCPGVLVKQEPMGSDMLTKYLDGRSISRHSREIGLKAVNSQEVAAVSGSAASGAAAQSGALVEVLRGVRLCLVGLLALIPRGDAARDHDQYRDEEATMSSFVVGCLSLLAVGAALGWWFAARGQTQMKVQVKEHADKSTQTWPTEAELSLQTVVALRETATKFGVAKTGAKEMMVQRLVEHYRLEDYRSSQQRRLWT